MVMFPSIHMNASRPNACKCNVNLFRFVIVLFSKVLRQWGICNIFFYSIYMTSSCQPAAPTCRHHLPSCRTLLQLASYRQDPPAGTTYPPAGATVLQLNLPSCRYLLPFCRYLFPPNCRYLLPNCRYLLPSCRNHATCPHAGPSSCR
jgi:hypothetical protein